MTDLVSAIFVYGGKVRRFVADRLARTVSGLCCCCGLDSDTHSTLCSHCLLSLPRIKHACTVCGLSCESDNKSEAEPQSEHQGEPCNRCARCPTHPPSFALCRGAFAYATPIDQLIADYKFNERLDIGAGLSEELGLVMEAYYAGVRQVHHRRRRSDRRCRLAIRALEHPRTESGVSQPATRIEPGAAFETDDVPLGNRCDSRRDLPG